MSEVKTPEAPIEKNAKPTNCSQCNKRLNKKRQYYRNGKYYCNKRCFKESIKKKPDTSNQ